VGKIPPLINVLFYQKGSDSLMKIQLALDRLSIQDAVKMAKLVETEIDWIEVGTSLIKEFGMQV